MQTLTSRSILTVFPLLFYCQGARIIIIVGGPIQEIDLPQCTSKVGICFGALFGGISSPQEFNPKNQMTPCSNAHVKVEFCTELPSLEYDRFTVAIVSVMAQPKSELN